MSKRANSVAERDSNFPEPQLKGRATAVTLMPNERKAAQLLQTVRQSLRLQAEAFAKLAGVSTAEVERFESLSKAWPESAMQKLLRNLPEACDALQQALEDVLQDAAELEGLLS